MFLKNLTNPQKTELDQYQILQIEIAELKALVSKKEIQAKAIISKPCFSDLLDRVRSATDQTITYKRLKFRIRQNTGKSWQKIAGAMGFDKKSLAHQQIEQEFTTTREALRTDLIEGQEVTV